MAQKSLNFKMGMVIAVLVAGSVTNSAIGLHEMAHLDDAMNKLVCGNVVRTMEAKDIKEFVDLQALNERGLMLAETDQEIAAYEKQMDERNAKISDLVERFNKDASEQGRREIAEIHDLYRRWWEASVKMREHLHDADRIHAFAVVRSEGKPLRLAIEEKFDHMSQRQKQAMDQDVAENQREFARVRSFVMIFNVFSILTGIAIAVFILTSLGKTINRIISDLTGSSELVSVASQQIASASNELSHASTEQASSLEETTATVEELTAMVRLNAENAQQAGGMSEATRTFASEGENELKQLMVSMNEIFQDSKKIEQIIGVVDDIAFQTNLLALNASVEAARAGEHGKGFTIVAEAVRNLAQRSASSAKDISDLIKESVKKIERGTQQASQSGKVLSEIVNSSSGLADINTKIAAASEEQATGIGQISKAMNQLDQVTQINAATSEEAAASAQELSAQAMQLNQVVQLLARTIHGAKKNAPSEENPAHSLPISQASSFGPASKKAG